jgi:hypothetical protein
VPDSYDDNACTTAKDDIASAIFISQPEYVGSWLFFICTVAYWTSAVAMCNSTGLGLSGLISSYLFGLVGLFLWPVLNLFNWPLIVFLGIAMTIVAVVTTMIWGQQKSEDVIKSVGHCIVFLLLCPYSAIHKFAWHPIRKNSRLTNVQAVGWAVLNAISIIALMPLPVVLYASQFRQKQSLQISGCGQPEHFEEKLKHKLSDRLFDTTKQSRRIL